jgi:peptide/nickel transport system substrate-binding protein/nickel transport system substrate-binding protein
MASLTACGKGAAEEAVQTGQEDVVDYETKTAEGVDNQIKSLSLAVGGELTSLYPLNMDEQNLSATRLCYEGLVYYEEGQVKPWLAKSWVISEDGKTITFKLREDVVFHDDVKFNAQAVKANFEFKHVTPNFRAWPAVTNFKEIEIVDDYTVAFHYDQAYFGYLLDFTFREIMVCVSPKVIEMDNFKTLKGVVGTGPYIYSQVVDGDYVKFIRNENYWGPKGYYDEIIVKYIPEASSRMLALQKGEVDMIYGSALITWDDFNQAIRHENVTGEVSDIDTKSVYFVVNAGHSVLKDKEVREAIAYGIDKKSICDGLTYGNQKPASNLFPKGNFLSDLNMDTSRSFDYEKAMVLLDEAGWVTNRETGIREKDGQVLTFKMTYNSGEEMNSMLASVIKSQLMELGIDVVTEGQDMMTWWKEGVAGNYGMIIWSTEENTSPQINFPKMLNSSPHTPSLTALEGGDGVFDSIKKIQVTGDIDQAKVMFNQIMNFNNDQVVEIPLYYVKDMILYNNKTVKDYTFTDTPVMFEIDNIIPQ